jgi:HEAT repeat protein
MPLLPHTDYWIESLRHASDHIWAVVDGMTNEQLELPAHIMAWLAIRDHVHTEAMRANGDVLDVLLNALQNAEPRIRSEAATLLQHLNDPRSIQPLENLLHDPDQQVRESATWTLQQLQPSRTQP